MRPHLQNQDRAGSNAEPQMIPHCRNQTLDAIRSAWRWIGRVLMLFGLIFVGLRFWNYRNSIIDQLANPVLLGVVLAFSVVYAISGFSLALGWWLILHSRAQAKSCLPWATAWRTYGKTQIAKYIPGNIFHFTGRHFVSASEGVPHALLIATTTLEISMMLIAAALISLLAVRDDIDLITSFGSYVPLTIGVAAILAASVSLFYLSRRLDVRALLDGMRWQMLLGAQLSYLVFFLTSATLFLSLLRFGSENGSASYGPVVFGSYSIAWAIGFLVPGAPAGMGVREAMLVTLLSGLLSEKTVLIAALLFRVITTLGDVLFFSASAITRAKRC